MKFFFKQTDAFTAAVLITFLVILVIGIIFNLDVISNLALAVIGCFFYDFIKIEVQKRNRIKDTLLPNQKSKPIEEDE